MLRRNASKSGCLFLLTTLTAWLLSCGSGEAPSTTTEEQEQALALATPPKAKVADASEAIDQSSTVGSDAGSDASSTPVAETPGARAELAKLRARFKVKAQPDPRDEDPEKGPPNPDPVDGGVGGKPDVPVLGAGAAKRFDTGPGGLVPTFDAEVSQRPARVTLSKTAAAPFRVEDIATGMAVEVALRDGQGAPAEAAEGYLVYANGHASGATLLHLALADGIEDYLSFDNRPAAPTVAYDVALRGVSGLRLVANTLEMLDGGGTPRLRVSPPTLMGANGAIVEAAVSLDNCSYDQDPAPPWGRPVVAPGAESCTVRVIWPEDGLSYPALLDPKWSTTGSMSRRRTDHTATLLSNGKVLVTGGNDGTYVFSSAELYDRNSGTWSATGSMTGARMLHTATQLGTSSNATTSGKVLVAGGYNGSSTLNTAQLYSPTAGTWVAAANLNASRKDHTATLLANGKVLVAGGASGSTTLNTAAVYNPATGTGSWAAVGNMATARRYHTATLLATTNSTLNNKVLVVGGRSATSVLTSVQLFDGTSSWSTLTSLSSARELHTATVVANGKVLFAGGKSSGGSTLSSTLLFNPASGSGSWASAGTMTSARHGHSATLLSTTVLNNGQLLVAGGWNGSSVLSSAELWNGTSSWALTTPLPAAVKYQTDTLITNGMVLIAGGVNAAVDPTSSAYLYDPSRGKSCTAASQCASGFCVSGVCCDTACADECGACNLTGLVGTCSPKANGIACNDEGNPCTVDKCNGASPSCQHPAGNAGAICRPAANACDNAESCTGTSTTCPTDGNKPPGTSCSDGNVCNGAETCTATGQCQPGTPVTCVAPDRCHLPGTCNPGTGQCSTPPPAPAGTDCGDGNLCNGIEQCDGAGSCFTTGAPPADDDNPCTDYTGCDPITGPIQTPKPTGTPCESLCLVGGTGTCDASHVCAGATAVTCTASDQCHGTGTCSPSTGVCSDPVLPDGTACNDGLSCTQGDTCQSGICAIQSHACAPDCPCDSGGTCTTDTECMPGLVCGDHNGRFFGKDPLSSNCWTPRCIEDPYYIGCGQTSWPCGLCPPAPPRICTSNTDCQSTNEVCGSGNGVAFGLGNVNVCWPPTCAGGQTLCGTPNLPCGNCSCATICSSKTCSTPDKSDGCGGYCTGLCGDGQTGCSTNADCRGDSICLEGTCLPPSCLALDPSRGCAGSAAICGSCPDCDSLCAAEGRDCGPAPAGCAGGCGTCSGGLTCVDGKCRAPTPPPEPIDTTTPVGALEGTFSVSDGGQAQYSIPIALPPGRAGLQPDIGLVYTSDKRLSPQGIGWRLAGFSQITRCSTRAGNEAPRSVQYNAGDRFCLDGKRLIALSDGTYRTEVDQFSKIVVTALNTLGEPASFKLYTKGGTIFTYGGDAESTHAFHVLYSPYRTMTRAWAISRVEDRNGNTMRFNYDSRRFYVPPGRKGDTLEMVPKEVSYGGNTVAGRDNDRGVRFNYTDVGIRAQHFVNGAQSTIQQRLDNIETYASDSPVIRRYRLGYESKGNVLRLLTAKECALETSGQEVCKPQTTFSYFNGNQDTALASFTVPPDANHKKKLAYWSGFSMANADGTDQWWLKGKLVTAGQPYPQTVGRDVEGSPIDVDNDGAEEFLSNTVSGNAIKINGQSVPFTGASWQATRAVAADIDGDGIRDVLVWNETSSIFSAARLGYLKGGTLTGTPEFVDLPAMGNGEKEAMLLDVDDDGVLNWVRVSIPPPFTIPPSPARWQYLVLSDPNTGLPAWKPLLFDGESNPGVPTRFTRLDANGDGLVDFLQVALPATYAQNTLWLNQGDGSFRRSKTEAPPSDPANDPSGLVLDFDGDGSDDFVMGHHWIHWTPSTLSTQVGTGVFDPIIRFNLFDGAADTHFGAFLADENGDGDLDVIEGDDRGCIAANCPPRIRRGSSRRIHLLTGVIDGVGRKIAVDYDGNRKVSRNTTCAGRTDLLCPTTFAPLVGAHHFSTISPQGIERKRKSFDYSYADARAGTHGRGSYGFGGRTIKEYEYLGSQPTPFLFSTTDLTYFNDDFALAGLLKSRTVTTGQLRQDVPDFVKPSRRVLEEKRTYEKRQNMAVTPANPALGVVFSVLSQNTTRIFDDVPDVGRQIVSTEVTDFVSESIYDGYDDHGNSLYEYRHVYPGDIAGGPYASTITIRRYEPVDTDNWLIGSIRSTEVRDTRSNSVEIRNWTYEYYPDGSGRLLRRTRDPNGAFQQVEEFFYEDPANNAYNLTKHVLQPGSRNRTTTIAYDASVTFPNVTLNAMSPPQPTTTVYDPRDGALVRTIDANGLEEVRTYDAFGRLTKVRGPSRTTRFRIKQGSAEEAPYPSPDPRAVMRVIAEEVSASGIVGAMKVEDFGPFGEILKRDVAGYQTRPTVGQPLVTDQWVEENFSYDSAQRLVEQTRPHLPNTGATDNQGLLEFKYDQTGQLVEERYPDETGTTTSVYHANATRNTWLSNGAFFSAGSAVDVNVTTKRVHTTSEIDEAFDHASAKIMDPDGLVVSTRDSGQHFTDYLYGPFRQLASVDVGRDQGVLTTVEYYPYGRKLRHSDPDMGVENYEQYNQFDELTSMTDARGINRTYDYDALGRMTIAQAYITPGQPEADETTRWDYDGIQGEAGFNEVGRLVRVRSGPAGDAERHQTRYHYQQGSVGLLQSVDRQIGNETLFSTGFSYDGEFRRVQSIDYPSKGGAFGVHRTYDQRGNLIAVSDGVAGHPPYWQFTEASQGYRIALETFGNNAVTETKYEPFTGRLRRLKTLSQAGSGGVELQGFEYAYFPNGNLEVRVNTTPTAPRTDYFGYDDLDRLTGVGHNAPPVTVAAYDLHGNITSKAGVGTYDYTAAGGWQPVHAPSKIENGSTTRTFFYDSSGNEFERNGGPEGKRTTTYTSFNLPLSITDTATALATTFEYDGDQTRVLKFETGPAGLRQTLYAGNLYERITDNTSGSAVVTHKYRIFAGDRQIAQLERTQGVPRTVYLHADHLGSTELITPETPIVTSDPRVHPQLFDPWGKPEGAAAWDDAAPGGVRNVHTGFTGHEHDPEHGLINMGGRIYDPELGRFMTADPFVQAPLFSQSYNRYAYVWNNPVRLVDPSGFLPCTPGFCQSMSNFFNTGERYFETGSLRNSEHDWWKEEFRSPREQWNDTSWLSRTEQQNRDAATITHGYLLRWDSELSPEQRAWKDKWYQVREAWISGGKAAAIAKAIEVYHLKGVGKRGPMIASYNKDLRKHGETKNGQVQVGPEAFTSVSQLISTLFHEAFHVEDVPGNMPAEEMEIDFSEAVAWQSEFNMRFMSGLSASEVAKILDERNVHLNKLNDKYRQQFHQGNRTLP